MELTWIDWFLKHPVSTVHVVKDNCFVIDVDLLSTCESEQTITLEMF